jgi:hypothetical protein
MTVRGAEFSAPQSGFKIDLLLFKILNFDGGWNG